LLTSVERVDSLTLMSQFGQKRQLAACLLVVLLLILSAQLQRLLQQYRETTSGSSATVVPNDFPGYYTAAVVARRTPDHRLYYPAGKQGILLASVPLDTPWGQTARAVGFDKTLYLNCPPFAALLLEPLGLARWQVSLLAWRVALAGLILASIYLTLLLLGRDYLLLKFVLSAAAVFSFFPFTETLFQGQIDPIIVFLWVAGVYFVRAERPVWSALCFALGTMVKVSPVMAVGLFLLRRQWKWLLCYAGWMALLTGIAVWRLGWENHVLWFTQVLPELSHGVAYYANKAPAALIFELYLRRVPVVSQYDVPSWLDRIVKGANFLVYCGVLLYFWKKNRRPTAMVYELVTLALVTVLISPVSWRHHYLLTLIPVIYTWLRPAERWRDIIVLAAATLAMGTVFPDYVIVATSNRALALVLSSLIPVTSFLLLLVLCKNYEVPEVGSPSIEYPTKSVSLA
jgi:hypothetical protein